jgi:hypothetical protein
MNGGSIAGQCQNFRDYKGFANVPRSFSSTTNLAATERFPKQRRPANSFTACSVDKLIPESMAM